MTVDTTAPDFSFLDLPDDELVNHQPPAVVKQPAAGDGDDEDEATKAAKAGKDLADAAAAQATADAAAAAEAEATEAARLEAEEAAATAAAAGAKPGDGKPAAKEPTAEEKAAAVAAAAAATAAAGEQKLGADGKPVTESKPSAAAAAGAVDYKAQYELIMAPFKANGRDIKPESAADVVQLMQMGANYSKKMAALKPSLTLLKMLEANGLLSEDKIGFLIDVSKKDPGAINKLVKESGLDPLDLGGEKGAEYKPGSHKVNPVELELDAVLDEIQTTPTYNRTIEIISKQFDGPSKQLAADQPGLVRLINQHVAAGIYDLIDAEIAREHTFGRLQGLTYLQAYEKVGDAIQARGGFAHLAQGQGQSTPAKQVIQPDPAKAAADEAARLKKLAASPSKPAPAGAKGLPADFNPLALSDDEILKLGDPKFN